MRIQRLPEPSTRKALSIHRLLDPSRTLSSSPLSAYFWASRHSRTSEGRPLKNHSIVDLAPPSAFHNTAAWTLRAPSGEIICSCTLLPPLWTFALPPPALLGAQKYWKETPHIFRNLCIQASGPRAKRPRRNARSENNLSSVLTVW